MCRRPILIASALLPLLGACAAPEGVYPTLATRDLERTYMEAPQGPEQPQDDSLAANEAYARANEPFRAARESHDSFLRTAETIEPTVLAASGAAKGSPSWSQAQVAITELDAHHQQTMLYAADIDRIYIDTSSELGEVPLVAAVRDDIDAMLFVQQRMIAALLASIAP